MTDKEVIKQIVQAVTELLASLMSNGEGGVGSILKPVNRHATVRVMDAWYGVDAAVKKCREALAEQEQKQAPAVQPVKC